MLDLAIVIVNYNTRDLLRDCLASVYRSEGDFTYQVWVVDNASTDGSAEMVRTEFPQARLIVNETNVGFAAANNQALREMGYGIGDRGYSPIPYPVPPRYILLLNPDTVLPPTALQGMLDFMEAHPEAGAAGPKLVRADGSLDLACRRSFPTPEVSHNRAEQAFP